MLVGPSLNRMELVEVRALPLIQQAIQARIRRRFSGTPSDGWETSVLVGLTPAGWTDGIIPCKVRPVRTNSSHGEFVLVIGASSNPARGSNAPFENEEQWGA